MNSCDSDTLCSFTKDSNDQDTCMPSKLQYRRAIIKGEEVRNLPFSSKAISQVIVSRIIDVNARLYERKHLHCVMQENEYSCNGMTSMASFLIQFRAFRRVPLVDV